MHIFQSRFSSPMFFTEVLSCLRQAECFGAVDPDDLNLTSGKREYSNLVAYSGSKLAQVNHLYDRCIEHLIRAIAE